jgi:hypothetical protein
MYIVHIMSLKINIWIFNSNLKIDISTMKTTILVFKNNIRIWNLIFESENCYLNFKIFIWIWYFQFKFKKVSLI